MIYTITFNPAVDLVTYVPNCQLGDLNRATKEHYVAGGKGVNMSIVLKRLGLDNIATGFIAGFTGQYIQQVLQNEGVQTHFEEVAGVTRINVKLKSDVETEINGTGPHVSSQDYDKLYAQLEQQLVADDIVLLAGNVANGLDETAYTRIAQLCQHKKALLALDTNCQLLTACLMYQPFIIKPNHHELGEIFNVTIRSTKDALHYAKQLQQQGARNVLVSRGGDGALLLTENGECYTSNIPQGTLVNSAGAGDSMLAGFIAKFVQTKDYALSLQQGAATGSATAFSVELATQDHVEQLIPQITVQPFTL